MTLVRHRLAMASLAIALSACAPAVRAPTPAVGLPAIPRVDGPLEIRVVHPTPSTPLPRVDSAYVYGSVGTGRASLSINGTPVEVQPNGAFLAYLLLPPSGAWELTARSGRRRATETRAYRLPPPAPADSPATPAPAAAPAVEEFPAPLVGLVSGGADTLATGSGVAIGRPTPGGTYRWFLPRGARVQVTGRLGDQLRVRLDSATVAWFAAGDISLRADSAALPAPAPPDSAVAPAPAALERIGAVQLQPAAEWTDLRIGASGAPFRVEAGADRVELWVHGREVPAAGSTAGAGPLVAGIDWTQEPAGSARASIRLAAPAWGYKAFYSPGGELVVRLRHPPAIDPAAPLAGRRIVIDPGHPPGGATGPTGLTEAEANLAIALPLAEQLRARGAEVLLTRTDGSAVPLGDRVQRAVDWNAELLVSVHNNAFAEGVNPWVNQGSSTYYFHPFSADLARALDREIVAATRIPDLGAKQGNFALVRPTWMPSTLTESLFMLIPQQEAALRDPIFVARLAAAHARGIEEFLRSAAVRGQSTVSTPPDRGGERTTATHD